VLIAAFVEAVRQGYYRKAAAAQTSYRFGQLRAAAASCAVPAGPNPYHNFAHACDVTQMVFHLLSEASTSRSTLMASLLTPLHELCLLVAALCHDLEHPGTSNAFQANVVSELAVLYNDQSPLENHHSACGFRILLSEDTNIFKGLSAEQWAFARKAISHVILHTDMSKHAALLHSFQSQFVAAVDADSGMLA